MASTLRVSIDELRQATEVLLDHLRTVRGDLVEIEDRMFWSVPEEVRYNVYEEPSDLTIGQLSDSLSSALSMAVGDRDPLSYGLVWLADVIRAIGEETVR